MLKQLYIKNYALIKELNLHIDSNLTTVTGETGAGKSILLGAIGLVLGQRADLSVMADQNEKCIIEATFDIQNLSLEKLFEELDFDYYSTCVIRREILPNGKSRSFVNDTPANLQQLKALGAELIEIQTQHTGLMVTDPQEQLKILDSIGQSDHLLSTYKSNYTTWKSNLSKLNELKQQESSLLKEKEFIEFQLNEIIDFNPIMNEESDLPIKIQHLTQADSILTTMSFTINALQHSENSVNDVLSSVKSSMKALISNHNKIYELYQRIESVSIEIKDIVYDAEQIIDGIEQNPSALEELNSRLARLQLLFRKHQLDTSAELVSLRDNLEHQLEKSSNISIDINQLEKLCSEQYMKVIQSGEMLSEHRKLAAQSIELNTLNLLKDLLLPHANLSFQFQKNPQPMLSGLDQIEMLFSANLGKSPQPLQQIASGGEISRLNFVLRSQIAKNKNLPTLIYDEADTGVSGEVAGKMGSMMRKLGNMHQVICITHLPQVAAAGNFQWLVYKNVSEQSTLSSVKNLTNEERITVVAKMLSGENPTEAALMNAKELLESYS